MLTEIEKDGPVGEARDERGRWTLGSVKSLANKMGVKIDETPGHEYEMTAPAGKTFNATETSSHPYTYGAEGRHATKSDAHQQMHSDLRQGFQGEEPPIVWAKSHDKDDTGDNIYKLHYGNKVYKIYWDQGSAQWNTPEALDAHGGTPMDFVAHTREDVEARIRSGDLDTKLARIAQMKKDHAERLRKAAEVEAEAIYLTASETAVPNTMAHARILEENGWKFHANDHDTIVYEHPDTHDEVRVWDSGNWIRYTKDQAFVSEGQGAKELKKELQGERKSLDARIEQKVAEAVAKYVDGQIAKSINAPKIARPKTVRKEVVRDKNNRIVEVIEHHLEVE